MEIKFNENGLIPAIAQDAKTGQVLMLAYMNREALDKTIETRKAHYFSRSRQKLWLKGETSGHFQHVTDVFYDCDADSILVLCHQDGNACHTGTMSCFSNSLIGTGSGSKPQNMLEAVYAVIEDRVNNPKQGSYTNYLFDKGIDKMLKKVGEESAEVIIAAKNESRDEVTYETADLMYHVSVVLKKLGVTWQDIFDELARRYK